MRARRPLRTQYHLPVPAVRLQEYLCCQHGPLQDLRSWPLLSSVHRNDWKIQGKKQCEESVLDYQHRLSDTFLNKIVLN